MMRFPHPVLVLLSLFAVALPLQAEPPSPLDLVRGLRDNQLPDLAIEYLAELDKKPVSPEIKTQIPLERAKSRLQLAHLESDELLREAILAQTKNEFEAFLKASPNHARAVEASLSLAEIYSIQAKLDLNQAFRTHPIEGDADARKESADARKAAAAATRATFKQASDLFGQASKKLTTILDDPKIDPFRKRSLTREALQAELQRGINQFNTADTYVSPQGKEVDERSKALADAKKIFSDLGKKDPNSAVCWKARTWSAMCDFEISEKAKGEEEFKAIRAEALRSPGTAVMEGLRMVEFFEGQMKYLEAVGSKQIPLIRQARTQIRTWLDKDRGRRMSQEKLSATYYFAYLTQLEGMAAVTYDKSTPPKIKDVPSNARALLTEAKREYQKLVEFDNEYTDRAGHNRTATIRILVGDTIKPPSQYLSFEECHMAALVQLSNRDKDSTTRAIPLLERCRTLINAQVSVKERTDLLLTLAYAYLNGGQPYEAAVLAEYVARSNRGSAASKAGLIAIEAYITARNKLDENDPESRQIDWDRALKLALYLDKTFPTDPSTDGIRFRLGRLFLEQKQYQEAYDMLAKISDSYSGVTSARMLEGVAAYQLINGKESKLNPAQKKALYTQVTSDALEVAMPSRHGEVKSYYALRNLLAQLHMSTMTPTGFVKAEQVVTAAIKSLNDAKGFVESERKAAIFAADEIRLRAVYMQALEPYKKGNFKQASDKLQPSLTEMGKSGPAVAGKMDGDASVVADSLDRFRRDFVMFALQTRIREGSVEPATQLFELLEKLGGSVEATTDALNRLVVTVQPQIDELRKEGKSEEADKLMTTVSSLIEKQIAKPKITTRTVALLGKSLRDLGVYDKAIEVLKKVPVAPAADLEKKSAELTEEQRAAVVSHVIAQLELARAHRHKKELKESETILKAALGEDGKGWARTYLEYRREWALLLEDKAFEAPTDKRAAGWGEARQGWTKIARDYAGVISSKLPAEAEARTRAIQDREKLVPIYLELVADEKRCLARMVTQMQAMDKAKLQKSLGLIAQQIVEVEKGNSKGLTQTVRTKFSEVLEEYPDMKDEYGKRGGKLFLKGGLDEPAPAPPKAGANSTNAQNK